MSQATFTILIDHVITLFKREVPAVRNLRVQECALAERDHRKSWRQFGHSLHRRDPWVVCASQGIYEMLVMQQTGFLLHEVGHIVAWLRKLPEHSKKPVRGGKTPERVQAEADWLVNRLTGLTIMYDKNTIQWVNPGAFSKAVNSALLYQKAFGGN